MSNLQKDYDLIVVGCGFTGATLAYQAAKAGKKVVVLEKRNHIAGNMYDYMHETGIRIQQYGPHSVHTNNERVYNFLHEIGEWEEYILRARVMIDGKYTPSPFNFKTIDQYYAFEDARKLKEALKACYGDANKVTIVEMLNSEDDVVRSYAEFLFEKDYRPYTAKQWGIAPEEIDISVLKRVPVRLDYTDAYFDDKYQLMPIGGYTNLFRNMLENDLIDVVLNTDAKSLLEIKDGCLLIEGEKARIPVCYSGPVDELFGSCYGKLPYRSLVFDWQVHNVDSYQETSGVAYPMADGYTRITEYKKLPEQNVAGKTVIAVEYPEAYDGKNEPYYPILTEDSIKMYERYKERASEIPYLYVCGRLGDFKYYNMDDAIARALELYEKLW